MKVGVMMPAYNAAAHIGQAIESVFAQTYPWLVLAVVDDGSTDGDGVSSVSATSAIASRHAVRMMRTDHRGVAAARNTCLGLLEGCDFIARMDSDDWDDPTRLAKSVAFLKDNPDYQLVSCRMMRVYEDGRRQLDNSGAMNPEVYKKRGPAGGPICPSLVAWKSVYDSVGPFNEACAAGEDGEWNLRALDLGYKFGFIDEILYYYRMHPGRTTEWARKNNIKTWFGK